MRKAALSGSNSTCDGPEQGIKYHRSSATRLERAIRWIFLLGFLLAMVSLAGISLAYGINREYRWEVAVISIDWLVLISAGALLSLAFKRRIGMVE